MVVLDCTLSPLEKPIRCFKEVSGGEKELAVEVTTIYDEQLCIDHLRLLWVVRASSLLRPYAASNPSPPTPARPRERWLRSATLSFAVWRDKLNRSEMVTYGVSVSTL
jgi:hypothetical protein